MNNLDRAKHYQEIINAYLEGKEIEHRLLDDPTGKWKPVGKNGPAFNFGTVEYRIKKESEYRPYSSMKEFLEDEKKHRWIHFTEKTCARPIEISDSGITIHYSDYTSNIKLVTISYTDLLNNYTWEDGSKCGIKLDV